jgi:hypothetical protein
LPFFIVFRVVEWRFASPFMRERVPIRKRIRLEGGGGVSGVGGFVGLYWYAMVMSLGGA